MNREIRILVVEDVPTDAELVLREIKKANIIFTSKCIETPESFKQQLQEFQPDVIISDYTLPRFNALEALSLRDQYNKNIPFILVTGAQSEEIAVECIKRGADDYILKSSLKRLPTALINAISKKEAELANLKSIEQLKAREEKYRNLFENSLIGMFRARATDWFIIEANQKVKTILGVYSLPDNCLKELLPSEELNKLNKAFEEEGKIENFEVEVKRCDNTPIWISLSAKYFADENIIEGVIQDISENKFNILKLQKINLELEKFVYHASHDLKSPLTSLKGLIKAARKKQSIEVINMCLELMEQSTDSLSSLINDLLTLARLNHLDEVVQEINIEEEINHCLMNLAYIDNYASINFGTCVRQETSFFSNPVRLRTVLNNLIANAIKYHQINQEKPYVRIEAFVTTDFVNISVEDNGKGIAQEDAAKIFDMFYRASTDSQGSGLGLYIVKNTIEKLGGKINMVSQLNQGTTFYISIPNKLSIPTDTSSLIIEREVGSPSI